MTNYTWRLPIEISSTEVTCFYILLKSDEMKRRRDFYAENRVLEPGEVVETFNIAEDEIISLSIQFYEKNK